MTGTEADEQGTGKAKPPAAAAERPRRAMRTAALGEVLPELTRQALGPKGPALAALLGRWSDIVGPRLATLTAPVKLVSQRRDRNEAVLVLAVRRAAQLDIEYGRDALLDRLNGFLGYRGIVGLQQVPWPAGATSRVAAPGTPRPKPAGDLADPALDGVEDPALRAALAGLKAAMAARRK